MLDMSISGGTVKVLAGMAHPLRVLYLVALLLAGITVVLPTYLILRSDKFLQGIRGFFDRLSTLTLLYLFFDVVGLVIIIVRNI